MKLLGSTEIQSAALDDANTSSLEMALNAMRRKDMAEASRLFEIALFEDQSLISPKVALGQMLYKSQANNLLLKCNKLR